MKIGREKRRDVAEPELWDGEKSLLDHGKKERAGRAETR